MSTDQRKHDIFWALLAGSVAAIGASLFVSLLFGIHDSWPAMIFAAVAGLVIGSRCWWLVITRPQKTTWRHGLAVGGLTGLLTHPLFWFLSCLLEPAAICSSDSHPLIAATVGVFAWSAISLFFTGWLTVLLGILIGILFAALYRWRTRRAEPLFDDLESNHGTSADKTEY